MPLGSDQAHRGAIAATDAPMTSDEYLDALRAAAHAGDRKAAAFLNHYASHMVEVPSLPATTAETSIVHPALLAETV
ncbi:MAG: hypothetical protein QM719_05735 [Thermomonas sp.]